MTSDQIRATLNKITSAPSCVNMQWKWEVQEARVWIITGQSDVTLPGGFLLRTTFLRPDTDSGEVSWGYGRWWHVPYDVSESGVVKTAYKAMMLILEHELMEAFLYEGKRVFDPHNDVRTLMGVTER